MPAASQSSSRNVSARDLLLVAASCFGAFELFYWALGQWAMLRFWEPWIAEYPVIALLGPFMAIAVLSGLVVGALVTAIVRTKSLRIAAWSGITACFLSLGAAVVAGGVKWATGGPTVLLGPLLALGLVLGALLVRTLRHA